MTADRSPWQRARSAVAHLIARAGPLRAELTRRRQFVSVRGDARLRGRGGEVAVWFLGRARLLEDLALLFSDPPEVERVGRPHTLLGFSRYRAAAKRASPGEALQIVDRYGDLGACPGTAFTPWLRATWPVHQAAAAQAAAVRDVNHRAYLAPRLLAAPDYRLRHDEAAFEDFYRLLYAPIDRRRLGDPLAPVPMPVMRRWFAAGGLLVVPAAGPAAAAVLVRPGAQGTLTALRWGVRGADGLTSAALATRLAACEAALWHLARAQGARRIDLGPASAAVADVAAGRWQPLGADFAAGGPQLALRAAPALLARVAAASPLYVPDAAGRLWALLGDTATPDADARPPFGIAADVDLVRPFPNFAGIRSPWGQISDF